MTDDEMMIVFKSLINNMLETSSRACGKSKGRLTIIEALEKGIENTKTLQSITAEDIKKYEDVTTEWIRLTDYGCVRYKCKKCGSIKTLAYNYCPDCGRISTNNIISTVERYNPETGKYEKEKENE